MIQEDTFLFAISQSYKAAKWIIQGFLGLTSSIKYPPAFTT
jgi:hypothetical protein